MKKSMILLVLILLTAWCAPAAAESMGSESVTIIIGDRSVVRDDNGEAITRLVCCTPVTAWETKGDMTYITYPRELAEIAQDTYTLSEYRMYFTGVRGGWTKTSNLRQCQESREDLVYQAEECRYELRVGGVYHKKHEDGRISRNKNFEENPVPTVDGRELTAHETYLDILHWNDAAWRSMPGYSRLAWQALFRCSRALAIAERMTDEVQTNTASTLAVIWQDIYALEESGRESAAGYGESRRLVSDETVMTLNVDLDACFRVVQSGASDLGELRTLLIDHLKALRQELM